MTTPDLAVSAARDLQVAEPEGEAHGAHAGGLGSLSLAALGVVFGDIGTSPIYAFKESLSPEHGIAADPAAVLGVLSLIVWSLTMVVTIKYLAFVMKANNRGEGGIFSLYALLPHRLRAAGGARGHRLLVLAMIVGAALLYGDGVITPAISVLSAVEGLERVAPGLHSWILPLTCALLLGLFAIQRHGTARVGRLFGPVMVIWFVTIAALGMMQIVQNPTVLRALSPTYALAFFADHGGKAFLVLGSVFLAVTGGEALYADMGHFGARPIRVAWFALVKPALVISYFGMGALLLRQPEALSHPFFALVPRGPWTIALVVLAAAATIIASQALISGAFSLTRQAVQLGYLPRLEVRHTSSSTEGQIYVPAVNWALAVGCLLIVLEFRESSRLAAAYGIAVTGTMAITSLLYFQVVRTSWGWTLGRAVLLVLLFLAFDLPFLGANLLKFVHGGFVPVLLGAVLTTVMLVWKRGGTLTAEYHRALPAAETLLTAMMPRVAARVPGTGVFMAHKPAEVAAMLNHYVARVKALPERVVLLEVETAGSPVVPLDRAVEVVEIGKGTWKVVAWHGFMEEADVPATLLAAIRRGALPIPLEDVTYFLGRETYVATARGRMGRWSEGLFAFLVRNATPADRFFKIPPAAVVEIGTQTDL
jgi:KUP system potassium uptake protein